MGLLFQEMKEVERNLVFLQYVHEITEEDRNIFPKWKFLWSEYLEAAKANDPGVNAAAAILNACFKQDRIVAVLTRRNLRKMLKADKNFLGAGMKVQPGLSDHNYRRIQKFLFRSLFRCLEENEFGTVIEIVHPELLRLVTLNREDQFKQTQEVLAELKSKNAPAEESSHQGSHQPSHQGSHLVGSSKWGVDSSEQGVVAASLPSFHGVQTLADGILSRLYLKEGDEKANFFLKEYLAPTARNFPYLTPEEFKIFLGQILEQRFLENDKDPFFAHGGELHQRIENDLLDTYSKIVNEECLSIGNNFIDFYKEVRAHYLESAAYPKVLSDLYEDRIANRKAYEESIAEKDAADSLSRKSTAELTWIDRRMEELQEDIDRRYSNRDVDQSQTEEFQEMKKLNDRKKDLEGV